MSQENVEIVRRGLDLLRESYADGAVAEGLLDLCAPDIRVDATRRVFNPAVYDGAAGVRRSIEEISEAWEDFHETNERLIDAGERVVVIGTIGGRGRTSQAQGQQKGALIFTVRDRLIGLIEVFTDPGDALKAVGLEE